MRYWRIAGIETLSGAIDITSLSLTDGSQTYPAATLPTVAGAGVVVDFDLGTSVDITGFSMTSGTMSGWPRNLLVLKSSNNAAWGLHQDVGLIDYPGDGQQATVVFGVSGTSPRPVGGSYSELDVGQYYVWQRPFSLQITPYQDSAFISPERYGDYRGQGKISGTVKIKGQPDTPVRRHVYLLDAKSMRIVDLVWSDPHTGEYTFDYLANAPYTVITYDYEGLYRAVIADNLRPEPRQ